MLMQGFFYFSVAFFPKLLYNTTRSFIRMWLSLVEHVLWEHGAAGSNPVIRTILLCHAGKGVAMRKASDFSEAF